MEKPVAKFARLTLWGHTGWVLVAFLIVFPFNSRAGEEVSEIRDVGAFHSVEFKGRGEVYLSQGGDVELRLEGDEELLKNYQTTVADGKLIIKNDSWLKSLRRKPITVYITMPKISQLSAAGSGSIFTESTINSDSLTLRLDGSGNIELDVQAQEVESSIHGSGEIRLRGTADRLQHTQAGSGDLNGFDLETVTSVVKISGSGNCKLLVLERLDVLISGSGKVFYRGEPKEVNQEISGSGKVIKME